MMKLPDFIIVPYLLLEDTKVSLTEERLYGIIYWFSKLKNEKCTASNVTLAELIKSTPKTVQNSLVLLEELGYIERIYKDATKRVRKEIIPLVTYVKVPPTGGMVPPTGDTYVPPMGDQNKNIHNKNNKEYIAESNSALISSLIEQFIKINPACKTYYANKTQRKACGDLIDSYSFEEVQNCVVNVLPKTNGQEYFPTITTPVQLRDKWVALKAAVAKKRNKTIEIIN